MAPPIGSSPRPVSTPSTSLFYPPMAPPPEPSSAPVGKDVVGNVPDDFGATRLPSKTKQSSPAALSQSVVEAWPDEVLAHQARVLQGALNAPIDYPGRDVDLKNLSLIEGEMKLRQKNLEALAAPPPKELEVEKLLQEACHAAETLAHQFAHDAPMRKEYTEAVAERAKEILEAMKRGDITPQEAATAANKMRNEALSLTRNELSPAGKVLSRFLKEEGLTLAKACEKYAAKEFGKAYGQLSKAEQAKVLARITERAGVTNATVNFAAKHASHASKALLAVTLAIAVYEVAHAEDKAREAAKQAGGLAGAALGGKVGSSVVMFACGVSGVGAVGMPACSVVGTLAGTLLGAVIGERLAERAYERATQPVSP